jgi:hypothetical protein
MAEDFLPATISLLQDNGRFPGPRAEVTGYVIYHSTETDGDYHFKIADTDLGSVTADQAIDDFVVCEIIPEIPMTAPALHTKVTVRGIVRWDIEHGWPELHPVLSWSPAT